MSGYRPPRPGGIPTECKNCAAPLNITGWCAECKLIARNERLSGQPADTSEPVSHDDAIQNVTAILGGRPISDTANQAGPQETHPMTELVRIPAPSLQQERRYTTSEMRKYKYAYETPDGRWRIERYYGVCGGGWRVDDDTTAGSFSPVAITPTLTAAKAFISEWAA